MENRTYIKEKDLSSFIRKTIEKIEWVTPHCVWEEDGKHFQGPCQTHSGNHLKIIFTDGFSLYLAGDGMVATTNEPEGYNGPGMYEVTLVYPHYEDGGEFVGYFLTFGEESKTIPTSIFRFYAESLEHARSLLNLDEVEYVKWVSAWPRPINNEDNG